MPKRLTTEEFIDRARKMHGNKYDYSLVQYKNWDTKVKIICPKHDVFEQRPRLHIYKKRGCPECGKIKSIEKRRKTTEQFIIDAYCIHGDKYNYKLVDYKNNSTKVKIICPIHGVFEQTPSHHLSRQGCPKCRYITSGLSQRLTAEEFIDRARKMHGNKYDYSLTKYEKYNDKVKIICPEHGSFFINASNHLSKYNKQGCPECAKMHYKDVRCITEKEFVNRAKKTHSNKYDYSLVKYKNSNTKVKIICPIHGIFEQNASNHIHLKHGCPKCVGRYEEKYASNNMPVYDTYAKQLEPYGVKCRRNRDDENILEVKCMYCDRWYTPSINSIYNKIRCINGKLSGGYNLYCSDECKHACPTYGQNLYPKGYKVNTSREVQPALRKLVLKRDNYTCQKCFATNTELHCHHYEGIEINPVESADMDNCITLCKVCHNDIHKLDKCGIKDYKKEKCK